MIKHIIYCVFLSNSYTSLNAQPMTPHKRAHHQLVYNEAAKAIVMTTGSTPLDGGKSFKLFNDLWNFNGSKWTLAGTAGDERSGVMLAYDTKRRKIFSFGGFTEDNSSHAEFRVLENGVWKTLSDFPEMKAAEPGFVYDQHRDRMLSFGGSAGRGLVNNITWEWNGKSWKKIAGTGPEGRQAFMMVYDAKRRKTVVYGGMGTSPQETFTDTWEFDGSKWKKLSVSGPGPRMSAGFAYDSKRGLTILFGGMGATGMLGDTWSWDGKAWKKLADTGPAKRAMGYMAYDKARDRIVLFGGRLGWPNDADDTWEWDGKEWKEVK
ncbi:MAG: hypothetical protein V4722_22250 [Bacteroidota bacterium]